MQRVFLARASMSFAYRSLHGVVNTFVELWWDIFRTTRRELKHTRAPCSFANLVDACVVAYVVDEQVRRKQVKGNTVICYLAIIPGWIVWRFIPVQDI